LYISHDNREEWTKVLGCDNSSKFNADKEMEGIKTFLDDNPGIKGLIICSLEPTVSE